VLIGTRPLQTKTGKPWQLIRVAALLVPLGLTACATPQRLPAVPSGQVTQAHPAVDKVRYIVGLNFKEFGDEYLLSLKREEAYMASTGHSGPLPPASFLAISGGGGDGAFGAGLITGWTGHGRPQFKVVTGISTGALIAPFAFLGAKYDPVLQAIYTRTTDAGIYKKRSFMAALTSDAMADTAPLAATVKRLVTPEFLAEIATEYSKGRILLVGTTDLDSQHGVIWNMTALAASKEPGASDLFRKILLASASIPGAFPPVMIDVTVSGKHYQEMHVDGGAFAQVFIYPPRFHLKDIAAEKGFDRVRTLYIIRNARLDPEWASVHRRTLSIATNAIASLIHAQGNGDLHRMYLTSQRDHLEFKLAYIPSEFTLESKSQFDPVYMTALFSRGRDMAIKGYPWQTHPPGYEPDGSEE
jgi:hypothetical protein